VSISEGRGTTIPFELFGAPFIDPEKLKKNLDARRIPGSVFRIHSFIPAFNKFTGVTCNGLQIHVTDPSVYYPVAVAYEIIDAIIETSQARSLKFNPPPYEYEYRLMPFDILSGDSIMRHSLENRINIKAERERWQKETEGFSEEFRQISVYDE
jgi:uncharacterized protein YbbC (DUF1343 family)